MSLHTEITRRHTLFVVKNFTSCFSKYSQKCLLRLHISRSFIFLHFCKTFRSASHLFHSARDGERDTRAILGTQERVRNKDQDVYFVLQPFTSQFISPYSSVESECVCMQLCQKYCKKKHRCVCVFKSLLQYEEDTRALNFPAVQSNNLYILSLVHARTHTHVKVSRVAKIH